MARRESDREDALEAAFDRQVSEGAQRTQVAARLMRSSTSVGFQPVAEGSHTYALRSCEHVTILPLRGAMSTPVTVLSWPASSSCSLKPLPDRPYRSTTLSRATASVERSALNEWSAMGWWKRWCTSGAAIL